MIFSIILIILSAISWIIYIQDRSKLFAILIFFNVYVDLTTGFVPEGNFYGAIRHLYNFAIVSYLIFNTYDFTKYKYHYLFIVYMIIAILSSSNQLNAAIDLLPFLSALVLFPISLHKTKNERIQNSLFKTIFILAIIYPTYILLANVFEFGSSYSSDFSSGFLATSSIYSIVFIIVLLYFLKRNGNYSNTKLNLLLILNILVLIINLRRTAIIGLMIFIIVVILNERKISQRFALIGILLTTSIVLYLLFNDIFISQLEARERITDTYTYSTEGRVLEYFYLLDFVENRFSLSTFFFGYDLMNSATNFGLIYFRYPRSLHSDILNIFYGGGFVGIILLISMLYRTYKLSVTNLRSANKYLKTTAFALIILFVFFLAPGRLIGQFTTPALIFIYLGCIVNVKKC